MKFFLLLISILFIYFYEVEAKELHQNISLRHHFCYKNSISKNDTDSIAEKTTNKKCIAILSSILVPGLGDYKINNNKKSLLFKQLPPWAVTAGFYGFIGTGILLKYSSDKNYSSYLNAKSQSEMDSKYTLANDENKYAHYIIGAGLAIWAADLILVSFSKPEKKKKHKKTAFNFMIPSKGFGGSICIQF